MVHSFINRDEKWSKYVQRSVPVGQALGLFCCKHFYLLRTGIQSLFDHQHFCIKKLGKSWYGQSFPSFGNKMCYIFDLHFVLTQKLDKSWNRARAIQHLLKEHLMFCHLPIHQPTSNIKWWFAVKLFRHLLPRMRYQWR